jgi:hypothetical protein
MIDHHYGHLARDANDHVIELLDNHGVEQGAPTVDAGGRPVDAANRRQPAVLIAHPRGWQDLPAKPSIGLEPMTPSLPWKCSTN